MSLGEHIAKHIEELPYQDEYGAEASLYGWQPLTAPFSLIAVIAYAIPWITGGWIGWAPKKRFSLWWPLAISILFFTDDVGTAIGLQAKEYPREACEGNPTVVQFLYRMRKLGVVNTLTGAMRLFAIWNQMFAWGVFYFGIANNMMKWMLLLNGILKAYAGYGWWSLKPNDYGLWDFITFKPGRETWERHSQLALTMYNKASDKNDAKRQYKGVKDSSKVDLSMYLRRRLVELDATGSRTARTVLPFFIPWIA